MNDIQEYVYDFVESIKEEFIDEIFCGEENHDCLFHFFDDAIIHFTLVTHNNLPFKISKVYRMKDKNGMEINEETTHKFMLEVNSLL